MTLEISVAPAGDPVAYALAEPVTAGGSHADAVLLPGAPPAAVRLEPCAAGVIVAPAVPGVRVAGHPVPPGGRRVLRPGERAEVHGASITLRPPDRIDGTRAAAAALLRDAASGRPLSIGARLVVLSGADAGATHPLLGDTVLGRGRRAEVRLRDPQASRAHARVRVGPDGATVEDLGSKNGLRVNGVRVERGPVALRRGDELGIGETALALEDPSTPFASEPAAAPPQHLAPLPRVGAHVAAATLLALSAAALALAS